MDCMHFQFVPKGMTKERMNRLFLEFYKSHFLRPRVLLGYIAMLWRSPDSLAEIPRQPGGLRPVCPDKQEAGERRLMRILMVPGNNSLSHVLKCLAVDKDLRNKGHETLIAISRKHESFLKAVSHSDYAVLPDIQERDDAGLPTVEWFRRPGQIIDCIKPKSGS